MKILRVSTSMTLLFFAFGLSAALHTNKAFAEEKRTFSYNFSRAWPAAVRFIRIDEAFRISEKDADTGYIVFSKKERDMSFGGTLEVIPTKDKEGRDAVAIRIRLPSRPSYIVASMIDRLSKKLRDDLGAPLPPKEKEKKKEADAEDSADKEKNTSGIQLRDTP